MKLIVFHKVLIISAIIFFLGYGTYEVYRYVLPGEASPAESSEPTALEQIEMIVADGSGPIEALWTGLAMLAGAAGLIGYLWWLSRHSTDRHQQASG